MAREETIQINALEFGVPLSTRKGLLASIWYFVAEPKAAIATFILSGFVILALGANFLAPYGENQHNPQRSLQKPSLSHPLGTDRLGRDVLSRIIYGTRVSLRVGIIAVGIAAAVGIPLGLVAGYLGKWADEIIMRLVDAWIVFPNLILLLAIVAILGPGRRTS